jgi:hypothetical protein
MLHKSLALVVCLLMCGCSTTIYKDQATKLAAAGETFDKVVTLDPAVPSDPTIAVINDHQLEYATDCGKKALEIETAVLNKTRVLAVSVKEADDLAAIKAVATVYKQFADVKCGLAASDKPLSTTAALAPSITQRDGLSSNPITEPANAKDLKAYIEQLTRYSKAIQTIVAGEDVTSLTAALKSSDTAIDVVLKQKDTTTVYSDLFMTTAQYAIQANRYTALKYALTRFDEKWPQIRMAIVKVMLTRYATIAAERANTCLVAGMIAQTILNNTKNFANPAERYALYVALNGKVDDCQQQYEKIGKIDPTEAIVAFGTTNQALLAAIKKPSAEQYTQLTTALSDLEKAIAAFE